MGTKEILFKIFSDENEKKLENSYTTMKNLNFKLWGMFFNFLKAGIPKLVLYIFLCWIFLNIYYIRGFEEAVIIALVGVMIRAGRTNNRRIERNNA